MSLTMIRAVISGLVGAFFVFFAFHLLSLAFFPLGGASLLDANAVRLWLDGLPYAAFLIVLAGYAFGSLVAGFISSSIGQDYIRSPLVTGAIITSITATKSGFLGEPTWMLLATLVLIIPFSLMGAKPNNEVAG